MQEEYVLAQRIDSVFIRPSASPVTAMSALLMDAAFSANRVCAADALLAVMIAPTQQRAALPY